MSSCTAPPSLLLFWYADEENLMERVLNDESEAASDMEIQGRLEDMRRRLGSRCRGLLEVHNNTTNPANPVLGGTVRYLHKTVAEFVSSPLGRLKLNQLLEAEHDPDFRLAAASVAVARMLERWRRLNGLDDLAIFEPYISSCLCYASRASPESRREILQLMDTLQVSLSDKTVGEWDSHSVTWGKDVLSIRGHGSSLAYLSREVKFLCMATQALVLEYTMGKAPRGCLIKFTRPWKPNNTIGMMLWSIQSLRGIPEGPALSLLTLPSLTDRRSYDMVQYLLNDGAKLNISLNLISAARVTRATPWEDILAKAIGAFRNGVAHDERDNLSKCLRLMIDRGAKVKDYTVINAFRLARESKYFNTDDYQWITVDRVYNALKSMKKDSRMPFRL